MTNTLLGTNSAVWLKASLPARSGGLGVCLAVYVAHFAFLSSVYATSQLALFFSFKIFPCPLPVFKRLCQCGPQARIYHPPFSETTCSQKAWDHSRAAALADQLLYNAYDEEDRARLLAASCKESGAWLNALPISSAGLRMDDDTLLCLGTPICSPHSCRHCNDLVNPLGRHGLSAAGGVKAGITDILFL